VTVAGTTIDRQCASGLQAIAVAARSIMLDGVDVAIGGGIESISLVQNEHMNKFHAIDDELMAMKPDMYMSMLETAEVVASRYNISGTSRTSTASNVSGALVRPSRADDLTTRSRRSKQRWR
jgi:acetyl-CoA C-acetyltransferase/acetyl-CoA acyltransferase